jgi:hypothetical protein
MVMKPEMDDLIGNLLEIEANFDQEADLSHDRAFDLHEQYNWDNIFSDATQHLVDRFG